MLPGVFVYNINKIPDKRGFFAEVFRYDWKNFTRSDKILQVNISESLPGAVKAWHKHEHQIDYMCVVNGKMKISVYDGRECSETFGKLNEITISGDEPQIVRVPGHYWHGTICLGDKPSMMLYLITNEYDYLNPDDKRIEPNSINIIDPRNSKPYDWGMQLEPVHDMKLKTSCRMCGGKNLKRFLSLGPSPLADNFIKKSIATPEPMYPLDVCVCTDCFLSQLLNIVSPKTLFYDYLYLTGASKPMQEHFEVLAKDVAAEYGLKKGSFVVDIGSNDGTLLQSFIKMGCSVLGIEPAANVAKIAEQNGIRTIDAFFCGDTAKKIANDYGKAKVILATNVFAHVDDLESFVAGVRQLLSEDGVFIIESPYIMDMLKNLEFDTIYHEHLSYLSLYPMVALFKRFGMNITDVKRQSVHGGSIRVFVQKVRKQSDVLDRMLSDEKKAGLQSLDNYMKFARDVANLRNDLVALLKDLKGKGARITAYGATAKGNTLLNYCNIGPEILDYISDTTVLKQGSLSPGMHIPVVSEDKFHNDHPDYALILAWNYADAILEKEKAYLEAGGKFIIPLPKPRIVGK